MRKKGKLRSWNDQKGFGFIDPGDRVRVKAKRSGGTGTLIGAGFFLVVVGLSVVLTELPPWVLGLYLAASTFTFIMYAIDKSAAKSGAWRTPESTLHWLSLIGGWPGGLVAQQLLRHKSKKQSFRTVFWATVILNCVALAWLLTPTGIEILQSWVGAGATGL